MKRVLQLLVVLLAACGERPDDYTQAILDMRSTNEIIRLTALKKLRSAETNAWPSILAMLKSNDPEEVGLASDALLAAIVMPQRGSVLHDLTRLIVQTNAPESAANAAFALGGYGILAIDPLIELSTHPAPETRLLALEQLMLMINLRHLTNQAPRIVAEFVSHIHDSDPKVRRFAVVALAITAKNLPAMPRDAVDAIIEVVEEDGRVSDRTFSPNVRQYAVTALAKIVQSFPSYHARVREVISRFQSDPEISNEVEDAMQSLSKMPDSSAYEQ